MCKPIICPECLEPCIHRDNRRADESACALGQIIHDCGPDGIGVMDIDLAVLRAKHRLLRIFEHKNEGQSIGSSQYNILAILDECIQIAIKNPSEKLRTILRNLPFGRGDTLDDRSGVRFLRGNLDPESKSISPHVTSRPGETKLEKIGVISSLKHLFDYINGDPHWKPRDNSHGRRWR